MSRSNPKNPVSIIDRCAGLNIVVDPLQPPEDAWTLTSDLAKAVDVVISDSFIAERAYGHAPLAAVTTGHSLFCDGGDCLLAQGTTLYQVGTDFSLRSVKTGMSGRRLDCDQYGTAIYIANGTAADQCIFQDGATWPWMTDEYNAGETFRHFEGTVPIFDHIENFNGFMLGAIGNCLYGSELGRFGLWNMKEPIMLPSRILMIKRVQSGVFVSDEQSVYFFKGTEPRSFSVGPPLSPYPAVEWSDCIDYINGTEVMGLGLPGMCAIWQSKEGLCLGTADGQIYNLIRKKIITPDNGQAGASLLRGFTVISTLR